MTTCATGVLDPDGEPFQVRIRDRADLVGVAPYLLGYHPADSVVVVAMAADGRRVCVTVRADLAHTRDPGFVEYLAATVAQAGGRRALLVVYGTTPPPGALPHGDVVAAFTEAAAMVEVELVGALHVADGRWWTYDPCPDARCCPAAGVPVAGPASEVAAAAVCAGMTALPDRAALAERLAPVEGEQAREMAAAVHAAERELVAATEEAGGIGPWRADAIVLLRAVLHRVADGDVPWLAPRVAGRLLVGLSDTLVRDLAWCWIDDAPGHCVPAEALWRQVARRAPGRYDGPPLFLAAWAAWRCGDGAMSRVALERALAADPEYGAALLLEQAMALGMDPGTLGPVLGRYPLGPVGTRRRRRRRASGGPA
jgi:hypothetical protein